MGTFQAETCSKYLDGRVPLKESLSLPLYESKYVNEEYDVIADIQDIIGHTAVSFPYVTREDIEKWLGKDDNNRDYPSWAIE